MPVPGGALDAAVQECDSPSRFFALCAQGMSQEPAIERKNASVTTSTSVNVFSSSDFAYGVVTGWEQLPEGWSHPNVTDVVVLEGDRVLVLCRDIPEPVIIYDRDGRFLTAWGHPAFVRPHGVTLAPDGTLYIVDDGGHAVFKFTVEGDLLQTIGTPGRPGEPLGTPFHRPTALLVGSTGDLYVTDGYGNSHVHCFTPDGQLRFSWGGPGRGDGKLNVPHAIVEASDNRLIVADRENALVQIFNLEGELLEQREPGFRPVAVTLDPHGNQFWTEAAIPGSEPSTPKSRLAIYDTDGGLLAHTSSTDYTVPGSFFAAHGIAMDSVGDVYVVEVTAAATVKEGPAPERPTVHKLVRLSSSD